MMGFRNQRPLPAAPLYAQRGLGHPPLAAGAEANPPARPTSETFVLEGVELDRLNRFRKHRCKARYMGKPNPSITVAFTGTAIGTAVNVSCHCGAAKNITDYDSW